MPFVEILTFDSDHITGQVYGRVTLDAFGRADLSGCPPALRADLERGIRVEGRFVAPSQGMEFLRMLKYRFTGIAVRATDVQG